MSTCYAKLPLVPAGLMDHIPVHFISAHYFNLTLYRRVPAMPDQLLYQLVKWCKSLPLLKNISVSIFFF